MKYGLIILPLLLWASPVKASLIGIPTTCTGAAGSVTCSPPTGAVVGSVEFANCTVRNNTATFTAPAGWASANTIQNCTGLSSQTFTHTYGSSDTTYNFTSSASTGMSCTVVDVAGASTSSPTDVIGTTCATATTGNAPTETPNTANEDFIAFGADDGGSSIAPPTAVLPFPVSNTQVATTGIISATPGTGATGTSTFTDSGASANWNNTTVIVKQGATAYVGLRGWTHLTNNATFTNATGHQAGDSVQIIAVWNNTNSITPPAACTQIFSNAVGSNTSRLFACSDAATYAFTGTGANQDQGFLVNFSNATVTPNVSGWTNTGTGTSAVVNGVTTTKAAVAVLTYATQQQCCGSSITPPGAPVVTIQAVASSGEALTYLWKDAAGASGSQTFTTLQNGGQSVGLVSAVAPSTPPANPATVSLFQAFP